MHYSKVLAALVSIALPAIGLAQGPTITTTTDYGVLAEDGTNTDFDAEANGTTIMRSLSVRAGVGSGSFGGGGVSAFATTSVFAIGNAPFPGGGGGGGSFSGAGVSVREWGRAVSDDMNGAASAGTSDSAPTSTSPAQGAHSVSAAFNVAAGTTGTVRIAWIGRASSGGAVSVDIDVDGDGTPDFSGTATGMPNTASIPVTAGANGVVIDITTNGAAAVSGQGHEWYNADLSVTFREDMGGGGMCTFTPFGSSCGADLDATENPSPFSGGTSVTANISNTTANSFGILIVGDALMTPVPLGVGMCDLLVGPMVIIPFRTDGNGDANVRFGFRRMGALDVDLQALVFGLDPMTGLTVSASNGLNVMCP